MFPFKGITVEISDVYNRLQPKINNRCLWKLIELIRKINVDKEQDYTVTAYNSQLDSTWSVLMSILRFNATVPWNGQSIALSVTHGCVHDSRPYLFTIAVFHGFFLPRFIILVIFIKIFVLIFFCRFLWRRKEDKDTSNLRCSVPSTWRIFPSESCLGRVTRPARNCRKQKGTRLWMSDFYSPPCGLRIQPTLLPMPQQTTFQEVSLVSADERQVYLGAIVSRCSTDYTKELAIQTTNFPDESSYSHRDTNKVTCRSEITQLHFPLQRNATFTSQTTLCQVFTCYGQFLC